MEYAERDVTRWRNETVAAVAKTDNAEVVEADVERGEKEVKKWLNNQKSDI